MFYLLQCNSNVFPCPGPDQIVTGPPTLAALAEMGISGASISYAVGIGFAVVVGFGILGWVTGSVIRIIRTI